LGGSGGTMASLLAAMDFLDIGSLTLLWMVIVGCRVVVNLDDLTSFIVESTSIEEITVEAVGFDAIVWREGMFVFVAAVAADDDVDVIVAAVDVVNFSSAYFFSRWTILIISLANFAIHFELGKLL
jgi:hypothetical protein